MWRHDQFHQGRLGGPLLVATNSVAFAAVDGKQAGLGSRSRCRWRSRRRARFDVYRASGAGEVGSFAYQLPPSFAQHQHRAARPRRRAPS
jgi:hypothetical protein